MEQGSQIKSFVKGTKEIVKETAENPNFTITTSNGINTDALSLAPINLSEILESRLLITWHFSHHVASVYQFISFTMRKNQAVPNPACPPAADLSHDDVPHQLLQCRMSVVKPLQNAAIWFEPILLFIQFTHTWAAQQSRLFHALFNKSKMTSSAQSEQGRPSLPSKRSWRPNSSKNTCSPNSVYLSVHIPLHSLSIALLC